MLYSSLDICFIRIVALVWLSRMNEHTATPPRFETTCICRQYDVRSCMNHRTRHACPFHSVTNIHDQNSNPICPILKITPLPHSCSIFILSHHIR